LLMKGRPKEIRSAYPATIIAGGCHV
jgi:hypothetical protein